MSYHDEPPKSSRNRSRRLRKKLHIGEFQDFGFHVHMGLAYHPSMMPEDFHEACDQFMDDFLGYLESHDLECGGGGGLYQMRFFVSSHAKKNRPMEPFRHQIAYWLNQHDTVAGLGISPLVDAWY